MLSAKFDKDFTAWLSNQSFKHTNQFAISLKRPFQECTTQEKSEMTVLPLSLENEGTLTGMASIIEEFGEELGDPCGAGLRYPRYDQTSKSFDLSSARSHYEFQLSLAQHKTNM